MRYVGRHRATRPLLLRRPIVGGTAVVVLLCVPAALAATGTGPIHGGRPSAGGQVKSTQPGTQLDLTTAIPSDVTVTPTVPLGTTSAVTSHPAATTASGYGLVRTQPRTSTTTTTKKATTTKPSTTTKSPTIVRSPTSSSPTPTPTPTPTDTATIDPSPVVP